MEVTENTQNNEYPKVQPELFNTDSENLQKLESLFPAAVKDGQLDIDALKEELGQFEEVTAEKYELTWAGKQNAKKEARKNPIGRTLKYCPKESHCPETTENLYIEGDNLEVLKLLKKNYYGSIKMIYIDPPYNTGNDFIYNDNFSMTQKESEQAQGERDEYGERLQRNSKDSAKYHTNWLNMIYPRLKVAKDLLKDDGIIFISINDREIDSLKKLCNEIFDESNFIATLIWDKNHSAQAGIYKVYHEYVLVYCKNSEYIEVPQSLNNDLFEAGAMKKESGRHSMQEFTFPKGTRFDAPNGIELKGEWGGLEKVILKKGRLISHNGYLAEDVILEAAYTQISQMHSYFYGDRESLVDSKGQKIVEFYLSSTGKVKVVKKRSVESPTTTLRFGAQGVVSKELAELFGEDDSPFDSPKPTQMIKDFILRFTDEDDIILDFFSGSATTAHSVMEINSSPLSKRKYILVQIPENLDITKETATKDAVKTIETALKYLNKNNLPHNICELGKERIRRAAKRIKEGIENNNQQLNLGEEPKKVPDIGFKVFKVADTTLNWEKKALQGDTLHLDYLPETRDKDRLDFTPGFNDFDVVYEIMLRQERVPLTSKIETLNEIGNRTYLVADSYLISLEETLTQEMIDNLSKIEPLPFKFVFRDSAFGDDIALKDETFRRLNALIDKNKGGRKQAYTVEFI